MRIQYEVIPDPAVFGDDVRWVVTLNDKQLAAFEIRGDALKHAVTLANGDGLAGRDASVAADGVEVDLDLTQAPHEPQW